MSWLTPLTGRGGSASFTGTTRSGLASARRSRRARCSRHRRVCCDTLPPVDYHTLRASPRPREPSPGPLAMWARPRRREAAGGGGRRLPAGRAARPCPRPRGCASERRCDSVIPSGARVETEPLHEGVRLSHYHTGPGAASRFTLRCDTLAGRLSQLGAPLYRVTRARDTTPGAGMQWVEGGPPW